MTPKTIYIIHPARTLLHYRALNESYKLVPIHYNVSINTIFKALTKKKLRRLLILLHDYYIWFLLKYLFKNKTIIFSIEPFSENISKIIPLINKHNLIYQTSWPYWDDNNQPIDSNQNTKELWQRILAKIKVVTVTETAKTNLINFCNTKTITTIPHAVNYAKYKTSLNIQKNDILFVGRFCQDKNFIFIEKLVKTLTNINFTFIGHGNEISTVSKYKNVTILPFMKEKELVKYYKKAKILILPSKSRKKWEELFGMVIIEAMASRTLVLASPNTGPKEILKNNKYGLLLELETTLWISTIKEYISKNNTNILNAAEIIVKHKYDYKIVEKQWKYIIEH
jgi:glycosyltransferase involved in cell wall biosynthesis